MESKIVFGKMIDYYRKKNNLTMEELGLRLGKTKSTISRWISGERYPKIEEVEQIAIFFNIDVNTLVFGATQPTTTLTLVTDTTAKLEEPRQENVLTYAQGQLKEQANDNVVQFPVKTKYDWRGFVSAGTGEYLDGEMCETIELPDDDIPYGADFALTVNGDSMKPLFKDHETIFVEETTDVQNGAIAVVLIDDESFVKKLYISENEIILVSLNPEYEDIHVTENDRVKIIGKVVM